MKVLCTGISGIGRLEYLSAVEQHIRKKAAATGEKVEVRIYHSGREIEAVAKDIGKSFSPEKVLDLHNLDELRALAFERIVEKIRKPARSGVTVHSIVVTHACFRWNKFLRTGFDTHYLKEIDPDIYVNLMDDVLPTRERQQKSKQWKGRLSVDEIITWRDEELFLTETLAQFQKKPVYLIARREPPSTLGDLLLGKYKARVYLSYPITAIKGEHLYIAEALGNVARRKGYVLFNPLAIKDLVFTAGLPERIMKQLRETTVWRDFKLIRQSDMVVVYYPVEKNSPGVNQEIYFGHTNDKDVYIYYPKEFKSSPFWEEGTYIKRRFKTLDELLGFFGITKEELSEEVTRLKEAQHGRSSKRNKKGSRGR